MFLEVFDEVVCQLNAPKNENKLITPSKITKKDSFFLINEYKDHFASFDRYNTKILKQNIPIVKWISEMEFWIGLLAIIITENYIKKAFYSKYKNKMPVYFLLLSKKEIFICF